MLQSNNNPVGYVYRTVMPAAAAGAFAMNPLATIGGIGGGVVGGAAVDGVSKVTTGKTWGENLTPSLGYNLGVMSNPGALVGGAVGGKVGYNYSKLGRYTLDNLTPAGYNDHGKELFAVYTKPLYQKPPSFKNGRKPLWYNRYAKSYGVDAAENRFQNGAIWARVPESEVPLTMYTKNSRPNSYRMTEKGLNLN